MKKVAVIVACACLLAGCTTSSLTAHLDGNLDLTIKAMSIDQAGDAAEKMIGKIKKRCENKGATLLVPSLVEPIDTEKLKPEEIIEAVRELLFTRTLTIKMTCK